MKKGVPSGKPNKVTRSPADLEIFRNALYTKVDIERARKIANNILFDKEYLTMLKYRACSGVLAPAMEMMLWYYVFGKPQETVNVNVNNRAAELKNLSDEELVERAAKLSGRVLDRKELPAPKDGEAVH